MTSDAQAHEIRANFLKLYPYTSLALLYQRSRTVLGFEATSETFSAEGVAKLMPLYAHKFIRWSEKIIFSTQELFFAKK